MSAESIVQDASPMRVWKATEKRWRKLKRWASLPSWQLAPSNRPLFSCTACGFVNTYGELCLQCARPGCIPVATGARSLKRRRASAPQLLNDAQKEQLRCMEQRTTDSYKPAQEQMFGVRLGFAVHAPETKTVRRRRHRDAAVLSIRDLAAAAYMSPEAGFYVRSIIVAREDDIENACSATDEAKENAIAIGEKEVTKMLSSISSASPQRTLRRKKRFSLSRQRSATLRSRTSFRPSTFVAQNQMPSTPVNSATRPRFGFATSAPPPSFDRMFGAIPLGHPARPFYTAIRKLSPPTSNELTDGSTVGYPRARSLDLQPSIDFGEGESHISRYFSRPYAVDLSSGAAGCSVSGEIELRMALARRNTVGGSAAHPEYRFEYPTAAKRSSGLKLGVRKIGQGLKNLVFLRRPSTPVI